MTETKPLLAFAAVIEHGTMHAAARALGMTPSAVSQHISRLEALHGVKLLKRSTRRMAPTEAGAALAVHCVKLRQALLDAQAALDNIKTEAAGEVRLALPSPLTLAPDFQAALLRVAAEFPKISIRLFVSDELADLQRHNIDIALRGCDTALDAPDLVARHLADWQWQIYAAPSYIAQTGQPESPADLRGRRWLSYNGETVVRHVLRRGAERFAGNGQRVAVRRFDERTPTDGGWAGHFSTVGRRNARLGARRQAASAAARLDVAENGVIRGYATPCAVGKSGSGAGLLDGGVSGSLKPSFPNSTLKSNGAAICWTKSNTPTTAA